MSIKDTIFSIIAFFCAGGVIIGTGIFCACAAAMQKQESEVRRP